MTIELETGAEDKIVFFAWLPTARRHLDRIVATHAWRRAGLRDLVDDYPFDVSDRLLRAPRQHKVLLVGRFLRDRFSDPRNWFEVWDFDVGLSRRQDEIKRALDDPLDLAIPSMELEQAAQILRDWCGLDLSFEGVDRSTPISCVAEGCPKGLLVDFIVKQVPRSDWYYKEGRAVVCPLGDNPIAADMEVVLDALRDGGSVECVRLPSETEAKASPNDERLPGDPAGLKTAARRALDELDYDGAAASLEKLSRISPDERERAAAKRVRAKLLIFHELTRRTPVSRLVGAPELHQITYRKPSGDLVRSTVLLRHRGDTCVIQEDYGASVQIRPERILLDKVLSAEEWQRNKEDILEKRELEARRAPALERVPTLVFNSLYAKTFGLPSKANEYLNEAVGRDEFETFLEAFFPQESPTLLAQWRLYTGRESDAPTAPPISEPGADAVVPEPAPGEAAPTKPVPPFPTGLVDEELVATLRRYAADASACALRAWGMDNAGPWRLRAIALYEEAEKGARELKRRHPDDTYAAKLLGNMTMARFGLIKDMGFHEDLTDPISMGSP